MRIDKPKHWGGYPKYYNGCGNAGRPQPTFSYPQGHPCYGCPYTFPTEKPSCTMGSTPGDCPWYFYKKITSRRT